MPTDRGEALLEGTVTIAFADLVGSTRLVQQIGDESYVRLIAEIGAAARDLAKPYRGLVPRHEGDGWMVVFGSARQGLRWAVDLQRALSPISARYRDGEVAARIGLHTGESVQVGADFQGRHVNFAARIADTADGGRIHVSSLTWQIAQGSSDFEFGDPILCDLPGFEEPASIYELHWCEADRVADELERVEREGRAETSETR